MKQNMMRKVIYALVPLILAGIYFYGWRTLLLLLIVTLTACVVEWIFVRKSTKKITEAVIVTSILYTLTLPPGIPYHIAMIGIIFGVLFGKMVFGGFGKNPFNPALVGRAFIYVNFPNAMTMEWMQPTSGAFGSLTKYTIDTISQSTPLLEFRATGNMLSYIQVLFGNVAGSIGETSAILIIIGGLYLLITKTASKETVIGLLGSFIITSGTLFLMGVSEIPNPLYGMLAGGLLFGTFFMATDPISSPKTKEGKYIYGAIIGLVTVIIRGFALFAGGMMFAILIGNTFAPLIDELVKMFKGRERRQNG
ncbi:RnfABCDGE type electron transport complex subunit D [Acidaminobacter sp. JC074]|nr:RnfABCDGE type electron transport complex subunit D [Acidaminobacter sp. JC074]